MDIRINVDGLRDHLIDLCGSAVFVGSPAAMADVIAIQTMSGYELCEKAEEMGVDLRDFEAR